jgi:hypothetical protein
METESNNSESQTIESDSESVIDEENQWSELKSDNNYEINNTTHQIRKKSNKRIVKECVGAGGYICLHLSQKLCYRHNILAEQYLSKPEGESVIDHYDKNKINNSLENLHYVSRSFNSCNRLSGNHVDYEFVKEISDDAIKVSDYRVKSKGKVEIREFDNLFFYNEKFLWFNGLEYRILHINESKKGLLFVRINDTTHKPTSIYYSAFKNQYNIL